MKIDDKLIYENRQWTVIAMGTHANRRNPGKTDRTDNQLMVTLQSDNGRVTMTLPYNDVVPLAQFIIPTHPRS